MVCYDQGKKKLDFFKDNSLTVNFDSTKEDKTSYRYGFHVTIRYTLEKNLCLVYRTKTQSFGKDDKKKTGEHKNIFDAGSID